MRVEKISFNQLNLFDAPLRPVNTPQPLTAWQSLLALPVFCLAAAYSGYTNGKNPAVLGFCNGQEQNLLLDAYGEGLSWQYGDDDSCYETATHLCRHSIDADDDDF